MWRLPRDSKLQRCIITKDGDDENYVDDDGNDDGDDNDNDDENDDDDDIIKKLLLQIPILYVKPYVPAIASSLS